MCLIVVIWQVHGTETRSFELLLGPTLLQLVLVSPGTWQCPSSKTVPVILEDKCIDTIDWPARFLDLDPIEHSWDIMNKCIPRLPNQRNLATIHRLIRSMPCHCRACIRARWGSYLLSMSFQYNWMVPILGQIHISFYHFVFPHDSTCSRYVKAFL